MATASTLATATNSRGVTNGFHLVIDALKQNGFDTIYGVPGIPVTEELGQALDEIALRFAREHGLAATPGTAHRDINAIDGYQPTAEDQAEFDRHQAQLTAQFLIDRQGVVRWSNVERAPSQFPSDAELLATVTARG